MAPLHEPCVSPEGGRNMTPYKLNLDKYKIRADLAIWGKGGADIRPIYGPSLWIRYIREGLTSVSLARIEH